MNKSIGRPITDEERTATLGLYVRTGILPWIEAWAKDLCTPLWWDVPEQLGPGGGRMGGTVCLVHTGERLLGITAAHIHAEIAARLDEGLSTWCQLGGHTFDPVARLIDTDKHLDVATYDLSEVQVAASGHRAHRPPKWPPDPLALDDICVVGGYPWELSFDPTATSRTQMFLHFVAHLDDSSNSTSVVLIKPDTSTAWTSRGLGPGTNLGGLSGGPVFRFTEVPGQLSTLTMSAVTSEYGLDVIFARPLSFVSADGSLVRVA